ncbi:MAG: GNAT family N-acetyltransferase [Bacteroidales bacterium]|nr:GNAT family N-acetyltransferase [Bacteroidales bacterium]
MMGFLVSFKRRFPVIWSMVETVNGMLFRLRYGRHAEVVEDILGGCSVAGCRFSMVSKEDLPALEGFLSRQDEDNLKWFHPHGFDGTSLRRLYNNASFLMMKVLAPDGRLVGYFFLRGFFTGRAFAGLIVDREWQNRGIGSQIWKAEAAICNRFSLRMQATISPDNKPSLASCRNGTSVIGSHPLGDNYLAVECKTKNQ